MVNFHAVTTWSEKDFKRGEGVTSITFESKGLTNSSNQNFFVNV